jgi:hypothetical protein
VYTRHVDFSVLVFSLSSYRHSYIGLVFNSHFIDSWTTMFISVFGPERHVLVQTHFFSFCTRTVTTFFSFCTRMTANRVTNLNEDPDQYETPKTLPNLTTIVYQQGGPPWTKSLTRVRPPSRRIFTSSSKRGPTYPDYQQGGPPLNIYL